MSRDQTIVTEQGKMEKLNQTEKKHIIFLWYLKLCIHIFCCCDSVCKVWVEISITPLWCILWAEGRPCPALLFIGVMETHNGNTSGQRSAQLIFSSPAQPRLQSSAADDPSVSQSVFTITEKAPTRAFSWLKAPMSAFTFKTLLRHYAKQALTPR